MMKATRGVIPYWFLACLLATACVREPDPGPTVVDVSITTLTPASTAAPSPTPTPKATSTLPPTITATPTATPSPTPTSWGTATPSPTPIPKPLTPTPTPRELAWTDGRDRSGRFIGVQGDRSMLQVYCPTAEKPPTIVFGPDWQDYVLMPEHDVIEVSWDKDKPVTMPYKPSEWRSILPEIAFPPGDNLKARWPELEDAKTFFERIQSAQTVGVTFPDGNQDSYRVGGMGSAWDKTCN